MGSAPIYLSRPLFSDAKQGGRSRPSKYSTPSHLVSEPQRIWGICTSLLDPSSPLPCIPFCASRPSNTVCVPCTTRPRILDGPCSLGRLCTCDARRTQGGLRRSVPLCI